MARNKDTCLCEEERGHKCGWGQVHGTTYITALREMGAVVKNGLGNQLPGQWARACWIRAYDAKKRLVGVPGKKAKKLGAPLRRRPRPRWPGGRA